MKRSIDTSWEHVATWYDALLGEEGTYQSELILPHLLRLLEIKKGMMILDLACGQGFFSREFAKRGASVIGIDLSKQLIALAKRQSGKDIRFFAGSAHTLPFIPDNSIDTITLVLAVQNMNNVHQVFRECRRVIKPDGSLAIVMTHPAFRIPKSSSWEWDEKTRMQYRRIDAYLGESKNFIAMRPGLDPSIKTVTYHRPLQFYFKLLSRSGFSVQMLEEWTSHKTSQPGPRAAAENKARKEIPLFLFLKAASGKIVKWAFLVNWAKNY